MVLFELFRHLALDPILKVAAGEHPRHLLRHAGEDLGDLHLGRRRGKQRILFKDPHEGEHALAAILRAHERHCIHLARLDDKPLRPHRIREHPKECGDLRVDACLRGERGRVFAFPVPAEQIL